MTIDILDLVREGCKSVASQSSYVHINYDRIAPYAASLSLESILQPEHDALCHYVGRGDDTAAFFVTLDAINFGSGYFPHLHKRPGMSGYFTVASSLNDYFAAHGSFSAHSLATLTRQDCQCIFDQDPANEPIAELMQFFANALNDLGRYLLRDFQGSFRNLLESANSSAVQLVQLLRNMRYFNDIEDYHSLQVPFLKRAQLTASDLALAFNGQGLGRFTDLDRLTIFADNLVPHVLRLDGLLRYEDSLTRRIDAEELIEAGSPEEVEIRACALHAVELLAFELQAHGQHVAPMQLDYLLWNRGQQRIYKQTKPRHRTRTVYY
jgi:Potential Queuosine, Q, salvage protein family